MTQREFFLILAIVTMSISSVDAQDFFWSLQDLVGGATQGNLNVNSFDLGIGESTSLFLYYNTANSELSNGGFLDLTTSNAGVINITDLETFDFNISPIVGPNSAGTRWGDAFGPGIVGADGQSAGFAAFTVASGHGIINANTGPIFFDDGYDVAADAFLFGRVDIERIGTGETEILIDSIVVGHNGVAVNPSIGGVTISAIPEPSTAGILAVSLAALVARRQKFKLA